MSRINDLIQESFFSKILNEWKMKDVHDFIEILSGFPFDSNKFHNQEGTPLIRIRDLEFQEIETYYNGIFDPEYVMSGGEILIGMDGDFNIVKWKSEPALLNQRIMKINSKDDSKLDDTFLFYQLIGILKKINDITPQTTVKHLSINDIKNLILPFPKIEEQQEIASILENVDNNIGKTQEIIEKYEMIKDGLMHKLLTEGIGHNSFKETDLGKMPKSWKLNDIDHLASETKGSIKIGPFGSQIRKSDMTSSGIKVYGQENVMKNDFTIGDRFISLEKFQKLHSVKIYPEDVLITMMGSIGYCTVFPKDAEDGIMDSHLMRIQINKSVCTPDYLARLIKDSKIIEAQVMAMSQGGIMSGLNSQIVKKLKIPIPLIDEQKKITEIMDNFDRKIYSEQKYLAKLQKLKIGLMQDLLTGNVRVKT